MPIPIVKFAYEGETLYSPFTGEPALGEGLSADDSVLFVHFGNGGAYAAISDRLKAAAKAVGIPDSEDVDPEKLLKKLSVPGAVAFRVDAGWNGINYYCFTPVED